MDLFSVNNHNYNLESLLSNLAALFALHEDNLGNVRQETALAKDRSAGLVHVLTRIAILQKGSLGLESSETEYDNLALIAETFEKAELLNRLQLLADGKFTASRSTFAFPSAGFSDRYTPSGVHPHEWPGRVFEISGSGPHLGQSSLLHPELPGFDSPYEAIAWFMNLRPHQQVPNLCRGQIEITVPCYALRIDTIAKEGSALMLKVQSGIPWEDIRYKLIASSAQELFPHSVTPHAAETTIQLPFDPTQLSIWIISRQHGLLDFYTENAHWNVEGRFSLLPKAQEISEVASEMMPDWPGLPVLEIAPVRRDTAKLIWSLQDLINGEFHRRWSFRLFFIHEHRTFASLAEECTDEEQFHLRVQALACLVDWMNVSTLTKLVGGISEPGSINLLDAFLAKELPRYDPKIVLNLRRIMLIRKRFPTHRDPKEVRAAFEELDQEYPPRDWGQVWLKLLETYHESLMLLKDALGSHESQRT